MYLGSDHRHPWGVILAGGEGVRLRSLTRLVSGEDTPKQFCPLLGGRTLLAQTKQRIARGISPERTVYVLLSAHERFYSKELRSVPPSQMIAQPRNRGTLPAIICSLINIVRQDPEAVVGFFPSDHHYADEDKFMAGVELAFAAAESNPERVILLGVAARHAETDYGWIEAEPALSTATSDGLLKVKRFWEKPSPRTAEGLLERGCVWNTFVMIGRAQSFLDMIRGSAPGILQEFARVIECDTADWNSAAVSAVYEELATTDFSASVLSSNPERLGVWCLGDVGWSDLGDPKRVVSMLSETGVNNEWMALWQERSSVVVAGN
jgi:mannose-1-phosphate guanylyltransferase